MTCFYSPTSDLLDGGIWIPSVGSDLFTVIDDPRITIDPDRNDPDLDFVQSPVGAGGVIENDSFAVGGWPMNHFNRDYGDNTTKPVVWTVSSVIVYYRIRLEPFVGSGNVTLDPLLTNESGSFVDVTASPILVSSTSWVEFSVTFTTDPYISGAWTPSNLQNRGFGLYRVTNNTRSVQCSRIYLETEEAMGSGERQAPLGPRTGEPAYFCVICGIPKKITDLIRPTDPLHPNHGQLVCRKDFDVSAESERESVRDSARREGDIDFLSW